MSVADAMFRVIVAHNTWPVPAFERPTTVKSLVLRASFNFFVSRPKLSNSSHWLVRNVFAFLQGRKSCKVHGSFLWFWRAMLRSCQTHRKPPPTKISLFCRCSKENSHQFFFILKVWLFTCVMKVTVLPPIASLASPQTVVMLLLLLNFLHDNYFHGFVRSLFILLWIQLTWQHFFGGCDGWR